MKPRWEKTEAALAECLAERAAPGGVLRVSRAGMEVFLKPFGVLGADDGPWGPVRPDTVYDVASLTKPLAATATAMLLCEEGSLGLDDTVGAILGREKAGRLCRLTVRRLLCHASGLRAWAPLHEEIERRSVAPRSAEARRLVFELTRAEETSARPGEAAVYSDLGFILLTECLEAASSERLDRFFAKRVAEPLGLGRTFFVDLSGKTPPPVPPDEIAPSERRPPWDKGKGRFLRGEVHDDNARAGGGVFGHAGLFTTAGEAGRLCDHLLACHRGEEGLFRPETVRAFWTRQETPPGGTWRLGWDSPAPPESGVLSSAGSRFSENSAGHLGFTGASVWIDLDAALVVVLLANRVHPTRENERFKSVRRRIHDAVREDLAGLTAQP